MTKCTCPYCGDRFDGIVGVSRHIAKKPDSQHPIDEYEEAREYYLEERPDDRVVVERGETTETEDVTDHETCVAFTSPGFRDMTDKACPECGSRLIETGIGMRFEGEHDGQKVVGETEEGDRMCKECMLIRSEDGTVVKNVG